MTAEQIAALFHARRIGDARWIARCPAHPDRSPSLSIGTGRDRKVLLFCFAGCSVTAILSVLGLKLGDLFPGPPPSPAERRKAEAAREAQQREAEARGRADGEARDTVRKLEAVTDALGAQLARAVDDEPGGDALARLYHVTLDRLRQAEAKLEGRP